MRHQENSVGVVLDITVIGGDTEYLCRKRRRGPAATAPWQNQQDRHGKCRKELLLTTFCIGSYLTLIRLARL